MGLIACPACRRHVEEAEARCPFCQAALEGAAAPGGAPSPRAFGTVYGAPAVRPVAPAYGAPPRLTAPDHSAGPARPPAPVYGAPPAPAVLAGRLLFLVLLLVLGVAGVVAVAARVLR